MSVIVLPALIAWSCQVGAQTYTYSTLAGYSGYGSADGTNLAARFWNPSGAAVDSGGNIYVADTDNCTIRKITAAGVVTTLAGQAGSTGTNDGAGSAARFWYPTGVAVDGASNVYVADSFNNTIRKITSGGVVTTLAGLAGSQGTNDGTNSTARFYDPKGVAVDGASNVYVADTFNSAIRKITPAGVVTTLAGLAGVSGSADGTNSAARFNLPYGLTADGAGNVYVADTDNHTVRQITPAGVVTTLAGLAGAAGSSDGTNYAARFYNPQSVAVDGTGNVYVADSGNNTIRKILSAGGVSTPAGLAGVYGTNDGPGSAARFNAPGGVAVDAAGNVYVADSANNTLRKISPAVVVTTFAGLAGGEGAADATGSAAQFNWPEGMAADGAGNVYVADAFNNTIRKITASGVVTTTAGLAGSTGTNDGTNSAARFWQPTGVAVDSATNLYVADSYNCTIRKITAEGVVSTLAGLAGGKGSTDGTNSGAQFAYPEGVAVDGFGNVYVADTYNDTIRKITPAGVVTTLAGLAGSSGSADGTNSAARFAVPVGVAVDGAGNVYVADTDNDTIRKITPAGVVTTTAGSAGKIGDMDGAGAAARFYNPFGVAVDGAGHVYVADTENNTIRMGVAVIPNPVFAGPFSYSPAGFSGNLSVVAGQVYQIQSAGTLAAAIWSPVTNFTAAGTNYFFQDPSATNHPVRFYRAVSP